jgi:hypothetical protein
MLNNCSGLADGQIATYAKYVCFHLLISLCFCRLMIAMNFLFNLTWTGRMGNIYHLNLTGVCEIYTHFTGNSRMVFLAPRNSHSIAIVFIMTVLIHGFFSVLVWLHLTDWSLSSSLLKAAWFFVN